MKGDFSNIDNFWFLVKWKPRQNGEVPMDSIVRYCTLAKYEPYLIIKFWENAYTDSLAKKN